MVGKPPRIRWITRSPSSARPRRGPSRGREGGLQQLVARYAARPLVDLQPRLLAGAREVSLLGRAAGVVEGLHLSVASLPSMLAPPEP